MLIVALILIGLLSLIGLGGMRHTTIEEGMAFNHQAKSITFQAAETAIQGVMANQATILNNAANQGVGATVQGAYTSLANVGADTTVGSSSTTTFVRVAPRSGTSLGVDGSAMADFHFDIAGTGSITAASATSIHRQGVKRIGPVGGAGLY